MPKQYADIKFIERVGKRLREIRESKKLSQDTVDMDIDVNCSRIERGKSNITISTLSRFCNYYGISVEEFFRGM